MWQILTKPKVLVYLDADYGICSTRKSLDWTHGEYQQQIHRLAHAKEHCDIYIQTDDLTIEQVLSQVLNALT
jgi:hypothetical protein